jgi:hypothetical protein
VAAHVAVAERAFGGLLPEGSIVHHVDENPRNNAHENLVVCPSEAYHKLLHRRARAYDACGNANAQKCQFCEEWDTEPEKMSTVQKRGRPSLTFYHATCRNEYRRNFNRLKGYSI